MKSTSKDYHDLAGRRIPLDDLDAEERALVIELQAEARHLNDWNAFDNYFLQRLHDFYTARGLSRTQIVKTVTWRVAQDLSGRIAVEAGLARPPDYRDELEEIIRTRFKSHREFCEATGLSEDMVSHVLARRKHIGIDTLNHALARIGYTIRIAKRPA